MSGSTTRPISAGEALQLGSERLGQAGVESARLDMSLLLARVLGTDRLGLYIRLDRLLTEDERLRARQWLARRLEREPLAYILGEKEFFGLAMEVDSNVLIPRPETEHLVEAAIEWLQAERPTRPEPLLADIGTGSGAIAVAVACHCPWSRWIATDISDAALRVARRNAERQGVADRIEFRQGDLLEPIRETIDALCGNPPYVPEPDRAGLAPEVGRWEPPLALFGGPDGLSHLGSLLADAPRVLRPGGLLLLECGQGQAGVLAERVAADARYGDCRTLPDLAGIARVLRIELTGG